jgi:hypothetical protein
MEDAPAPEHVAAGNATAPEQRSLIELAGVARRYGMGEVTVTALHRRPDRERRAAGRAAGDAVSLPLRAGRRTRGDDQTGWGHPGPLGGRASGASPCSRALETESDPGSCDRMTRSLLIRLRRLRLAALLFGGVLGFWLSPRGMGGKVMGSAL